MLVFGAIALVASLALVLLAVTEIFGSPRSGVAGRVICDCRSAGFKESHLRRGLLLGSGVMWLLFAAATATSGIDLPAVSILVLATAFGVLKIRRWHRHPEGQHAAAHGRLSGETA